MKSFQLCKEVFVSKVVYEIWYERFFAEQSERNIVIESDQVRGFFQNNQRYTCQEAIFSK